MKKILKGEFTLDLETGTAYFSNEKGETVLRLTGLPAPIPNRDFYDIQHIAGNISWTPVIDIEKSEFSKTL